MDLWRPNALLLGPGGVKGFLMIGSLLLLEKSKMLKDVKKIVGVSMGAIIGLFISVGCSITEILEIGLMTELSEVMTAIDVIHIMKKNGLVSHDIFRNRMREKVIQKLGFVPTLQQLHAMTGIEFEVVVTNLDKDQAEYFNYQTQPSLCCVEATIMSMSLPLFFHTYTYQDCIYLDGGIADPFPIHRFKNENVLAIRMLGSHLDPKDSFFNYIAKVVNCLTSQQRHFKNNLKCCKILDLEYEVNDAIGVKVNFEKRVEMVMIGFQKSFEFLNKIGSGYRINIEKQLPKGFFESIQIPKKTSVKKQTSPKQSAYSSETETSDIIEQEGDEYLEDCFDSTESSLFDVSDDDNSWATEEENDESETDSEEQRERRESARSERSEPRDRSDRRHSRDRRDSRARSERSEPRDRRDSETTKQELLEENLFNFITKDDDFSTINEIYHEQNLPYSVSSEEKEKPISTDDIFLNSRFSIVDGKWINKCKSKVIKTPSFLKDIKDSSLK
jgi:predicted patatin/cPLA2 family phospholipase